MAEEQAAQGRRVTLGRDDYLLAQRQDDDDEEGCDLGSEELTLCIQQLSQEEFVDFDEILASMPLPPQADQASTAAAAAASAAKVVDQAGTTATPPSSAGNEVVPQQHGVASSSNSNKRQRVDLQTKITDAFQSVDSTTSVPAAVKLKDTDDKMFLGNDKLFKRGDTWTSNNKPGYFFTIQCFKKNKGRKEAVCVNHVDILLKKTFIGQKESNRLVQEWTKANKKDPEKAHCANTLLVLEKGRVPLKDLKERQPTNPEPDLIWESGLKDAHGVGFTCAYRFKRNTGPSSFGSRTLPRKPVALDLFAGCGGMSLGLKMAGFDPKFKVEIDPMAAATLELNNPDSVVFNEDVDVFQMKAETGLFARYPRPGDIDHIHASPPCQGYSDANRNGESLNMYDKPCEKTQRHLTNTNKLRDSNQEGKTTITITS